MSDQKILVVIGATGVQGGSVIKSVLSDPKAAATFKLRGITRDVSSPRAKALSEKGVECVTGDVNDKGSLKHAFRDAHTVFAVTDYWQKMDAKLELQQGKDIADAAKEEGVQHLIFSTLTNVTKLTSGKFPNVYHFDSKAHIEDYIRSLGIPASFFMPGFYMSNFETMMNPGPQGGYVLAMPIPPTTPIPLFDAAHDTGKFVKAMAMKREKVLGKNILAATNYTSVEDVVETFKKVKPETGAAFITVDKDTYKGFLAKAGMPDFAQEELYENMVIMDEFGYFGKQSLEESLALLDEKPTEFADFVAKSPKWKDLK
ncbi:MAG: hypothetical protein Q9217_004612 [Psora testacea]